MAIAILVVIALVLAWLGFDPIAIAFGATIVALALLGLVNFVGYLSRLTKR